MAGLERYEATIEEFDIERTLAFAEHLVTQSSRLWVEADLDLRQRLQLFSFPRGSPAPTESFEPP